MLFGLIGYHPIFFFLSVRLIALNQWPICFSLQYVAGQNGLHDLGLSLKSAFFSGQTINYVALIIF